MRHTLAPNENMSAGLFTRPLRCASGLRQYVAPNWRPRMVFRGGACAALSKSWSFTSGSP